MKKVKMWEVKFSGLFPDAMCVVADDIKHAVDKAVVKKLAANKRDMEPPLPSYDDVADSVESVELIATED